MSWIAVRLLLSAVCFAICAFMSIGVAADSNGFKRIFWAGFSFWSLYIMGRLVQEFFKAALPI